MRAKPTHAISVLKEANAPFLSNSTGCLYIPVSQGGFS